MDFKDVVSTGHAPTPPPKRMLYHDHDDAVAAAMHKNRERRKFLSRRQQQPFRASRVTMRAFVDIHGDALYELHDALATEMSPWGVLDRHDYDDFLKAFEPHVSLNSEHVSTWATAATDSTEQDQE